MTSGDWSDSENDAVVATYFAMLSDELSGRAYNKAAHNRALREQTGRSRGSIEFKMDLPGFGGERLAHFPGLSLEGDGALEAER